MPTTKITPLPKMGGGAGAGSKAATKPNTKGTNPKSTNIKSAGKSTRFKNRFTSRFAVATQGLSKVAAARGKGYLHAIIFTTCVGLGLLIFGIVLVYIGDDKYIVDVMVFGGLCIVMGTGSLALGCLFTLRPIFKERRHMKEKSECRTRRASHLPGSAQDNYINPAFIMDVLTVPPPVTSTSTSTPVSNDLYDKESLRFTETVQGRLVPPSPPPVSQPSQEQDGTTFTVLTTVGSERNDVSDVEEDKQTVR